MENNLIENSNEIIIFNGAFENGNEQLIQLQSANETQFVLRRNLYIEDTNGHIIWNESERKVTSVTEYLSQINSNIIKYTPMELNPDYAEIFKDTLLAGLRLISQKTELDFFGSGSGFNKWMRWAKHFQEPNLHATRNISLYGFGKRTPVSQVKIDLPMIATIQQLLDNAYTAFLMNTYRPGRFGRDWTLYNLTRCQIFGSVPREVSPSPEFVNTGDDIAILRLTPT